MTAAPARYPGVAPIEAYGSGGFRFAGMSHRGSILCLPSGIYAWEPSMPLEPDAFAAVLAEKERIGLLILGTGERQVLPAPGVRRAFADAGWRWRRWTPAPPAAPTTCCWPRAARLRRH